MMPLTVSHDERSTRIQSVSRASRLLLEVASRPAGATELAAATGLAVPTAHHLLSTLCHEGLLGRTDDRGYVLGPQVAVLVDGYLRDGTPDFLMTPLATLAHETSETVYLTAWRGGEIHALHSIEGEGAVRVAPVERGRYRFPHARATGKLLLAYARPERRERLLGDEPLESFTGRTITDRVLLERELTEIRKRGWAEDHEEFRDGVACIAVPALLGDIVLAAYTVACPAERLPARRDDLLSAARRAAAVAAAHPDAGEQS